MQNLPAIIAGGRSSDTSRGQSPKTSTCIPCPPIAVESSASRTQGTRGKVADRNTPSPARPPSEKMVVVMKSGDSEAKGRSSRGSSPMTCVRSATKQPAQVAMTMMQELAGATEKAFASGMGDWDLQPPEPGSYGYRSGILRGPLGPEALKNIHGMDEKDILRLYRLLQIHCVDFQKEMVEVCAHAEAKEGLITAVWHAFAQLWDETLRVSFQSEVANTVKSLQANVKELKQVRRHCQQVEADNQQLQERLNEFVKQSLDHMLDHRVLKSKVDGLEGEVAMLTAANSQLGIRAATAEIRQQQLHLQLDSQAAQLVAAEGAARHKEGLTQELQTTVMQRDSTVKRQYAQIGELSQQLLASQDEKQTLKEEISRLEALVENVKAMKEESDRKLQDKVRAYNLLYADYGCQKMEAATLKEKNDELTRRDRRLQETIHSLERDVANAQGARQHLESFRMYVEDLEGTVRRYVRRHQELVGSYWPVMNRMKVAETELERLRTTGAASGTGTSGPPPVETLESVHPLERTAGSDIAMPVIDKQDDGMGDRDHKVISHKGDVKGASSSSLEEGGISDHNETCEAPAEDICPGDVTDKPAVDPIIGSDEIELHAISLGCSNSTQDPNVELQQLRLRHQLMGEEYWVMKDRLLQLEITVGQLRSSLGEAEGKLHSSEEARTSAEAEAEKYRLLSSQLEGDLRGYKAFVRTLEEQHREYVQLVRRMSGLEDYRDQATSRLEELQRRLAQEQAVKELQLIEIRALADERDTLLQTLATERSQTGRIQQEMRAAKNLEVQELRGRCKEAEEAKRTLQEVGSDLEKKLKESDKKLADSREQLERVQEEVISLQNQRDKLKQKLLEVHQNNLAMNERMNTIELKLQSETLGHVSGDNPEGSFVAAATRYQEVVDGCLDMMDALLSTPALRDQKLILSEVQCHLAVQGGPLIGGLKGEVSSISVGSGTASSLVVESLKVKCRELEVAYEQAKGELYSVMRQLKALQEHQQQLRSENHQLRLLKDRYEHQARISTRKVEELQLLSDELQDRCSQLENTTRKDNREVTRVKAQLLARSQECNKVRSELEEARVQLVAKTTSLQDALGQIHSMEMHQEESLAVARTCRGCSEMDRKLVQEYEHRVHCLEADLAKVLGDSSAVITSEGVLKSEVVKLHARLSEKEVRVLELTSHLADVRQQLEHLQVKYESDRTARETLEQGLNQLRHAVRAVTQEKQELDKMLVEERCRIDKLESEKKMLLEELGGSSGYSDCCQAVGTT